MNKVNLNELHNLKEWAEIINVQYKDNTCSRKSLVSELERYGKFEKVNRKYQYIELYDEPKPKVDNRATNGHHENSHKHSTSEYADLQYVLLNYLCKQQNKDIIYITNNLLATKLITTDNYNFCYKNEKYFNIYMKSIKALENSVITKDVFSNVNANVKGLIATAMKNLNKDYDLQYEYNYVLNYYDYDEKGKVTTFTRQATQEEVKIIDSTIKIFLQKFNTKHEKTLSKRKKKKTINNLNDSYSLKPTMFKEFWQDLNEDIACALYDNFKIEIILCYKAYIIHHHSLNFDKCNEILRDKNIVDVQLKLKEKFVNNCIKSVQKQIDVMDAYIQDRIKKMDVWGDINKDTIYILLRNKFGDSKAILHQEFYLTNYTDILNLLILNKNITNKTIKDLLGSVNAIKCKLLEKRSMKEKSK